jgi:hypothetical protein
MTPTNAIKGVGIALIGAFTLAGCSVTHVGGRPLCDEACNARAANDQRTMAMAALMNHVNKDGVTDETVLGMLVSTYIRGNPDPTADEAFLKGVKDDAIREQVAGIIKYQRSNVADISLREVGKKIGAACPEGQALTVIADENGHVSFTVKADGSTPGATCMPIWGKVDHLIAPSPAAAGTSPTP